MSSIQVVRSSDPDDAFESVRPAVSGSSLAEYESLVRRQLQLLGEDADRDGLAEDAAAREQGDGVAHPRLRDDPRPT